ncbi:hypothetical protein EHS25_008988 [Saitozyma podzolica]|uniref:Profilin n=1 Tax=Saitozyma podzolica TaxID=1890683 RepID=A0A427YKL9_9TREE|nr:hypothetical protein EHS25_008988 [Saitozyma podzolica]
MPQNQGPPQVRSSGHKDVTEDHTTIAQMASQGDGADPEALLRNRVLNNGQVCRAALYDKDDFLCVASSRSQFDLEPDDVRKMLDGVLTFSRAKDPTAAGGNGDVPKRVAVGREGAAAVRNGNADRIVADLSGKTFIAAPTARHILLLEGKDGASESSLETVVQSFQAGLQALTL